MLTIDLERAGVISTARVLDLGCGGGRHAFAAARCGARVIALDRAFAELVPVVAMLRAMDEAGELPDAKATAVACGDANALPFASGSFDVVIASEILEHLVDDIGALREIRRLLAPGGTLALSVPRAGPERVNWGLSRAYHEVEGGHVRIYRRAPLVGRARRAGFELVDAHHAHGLHAPYWWLRCLVGVEREDHRVVRAYHRLLVWDIVARPRITRVLERVLDPLIGKSLVLYFRPVAR